MLRANPRSESSPSIRQTPFGEARHLQSAEPAFRRCICRADIDHFSRLMALQSQPHHHASGIAPCPQRACIYIDRPFWSLRRK
jgi:hypothetical protein